VTAPDVSESGRICKGCPTPGPHAADCPMAGYRGVGCSAAPDATAGEELREVLIDAMYRCHSLQYERLADEAILPALRDVLAMRPRRSRPGALGWSP